MAYFKGRPVELLLVFFSAAIFSSSLGDVESGEFTLTKVDLHARARARTHTHIHEYLPRDRHGGKCNIF